jgi:ribosomal protein L40E
MTTRMMDILCTHCGARMRWDAEDQCWKCFGPKHKSQSGPHREFEKGSEEICYCPECFEKRQAKG